jgi:hypothetical protein
VLRWRGGKPTDDPADVSGGSTPSSAAQGKGHPTPKRREAEQRRKGTLAPAKDRSEAKLRAREERAKATAGMLAGDERYFGARDRGPARAYIRNWVDGRRNAGEIFWQTVVLAIVLLFMPFQASKYAAQVLLFAFYGLIIADNSWSLLGLGRGLRAKFPDAEARRGSFLYAFTRSIQSRKRRRPPPVVQPGWTRAERAKLSG